MEDDEEARTRYFKIEKYETHSYGDIKKINYIEDLLEFSNDVKNNYFTNGILLRTLDCNSDDSYKNPKDTSYGDYNGDGKIEGIKVELTTGSGFKPIKASVGYAGIFDGKGYEIKNIHINSTNAALFDSIDGGTIKNLGISGNITGEQSAAGITVSANRATIINCYNKATINGKSARAGGIVANLCWESKIINCYNTGDISGVYTAGGISAYVYDECEIINSYNSGNIIANSDETHKSNYNDFSTGGIAGEIYSSSKINNSYNTGDITVNRNSNDSNIKIGGIVGYLNGSNIYNSYNTGTISGNGGAYKYIGGIAAFGSGNISNVFNIGKINEMYSFYAGSITGNVSGNIYNSYFVQGINPFGWWSNSYKTEAQLKTIGELQSLEFFELFKSNMAQDETSEQYAMWKYNKNSTPTLKMIETGNLIVTNKRGVNYVITKIDEKTTEPLENVKFVLYNTDENDFAKDKEGNYIGTQNEDGKYVLTTDENGKIGLSLPAGNYKAIEIETLEGYVLKEEPLYFRVEEETVVTTPADIEINYIEDLLELSDAINSGITYSGQTIRLMRTLDFNDDFSYKNPYDTSRGDYNYENGTQGIKLELTTGQGFEPIGSRVSNYTYGFAGTFDGNGYEIKNLYINRFISNVGLFAYLNNATVTNLGITGNGSITVYQYVSANGVGAIAGTAYNSTISNCYNTLNVTSENTSTANVGGIVGRLQYNSTIKGCYNTGDINGLTTGGIVSLVENSTSKIIDCYNTGNITGIIVGGIAGNVSYTTSTISNCYNKGDIIATNNAGGIAGGISGANPLYMNVTNCYNLGNIHSQSNAGGIVGYASGYGSVSCSYNKGNIKGNYAGGILGYSSWISRVYDSYNLGTVDGAVMAAGITGYGDNYGAANVANSYNKGTIISDLAVAGIICADNIGVINNCYNIGKITGVNEAGIVSSMNAVIHGTNISNSYYLKNEELQCGRLGYEDVTGSFEGLTEEYMTSEEFYKLLNESRSLINEHSYFSNIIFSSWTQAENGYPVFDWEIYTLSSSLVVKNSKEQFKTITKLDEETNEPLAGVKFAIYNTDTNDFAKNQAGKYIGTQNEEGIYVVITDNVGKLKLSLPDGNYKAVEIETIDGYQLDDEPTYFMVGSVGKDENTEEIIINNIEDLVDLSNAVNSGTTYSGVTVKLARTLDFNDYNSYEDSTSTTYGDYNGDGTVNTIKEELTKGIGFKPIGSSYTYSFQGEFDGNNNEIRNIRIADTTRGYVGLFGYTRSATIQNVGVTGSISTNYTTGTGSATVGGIVGSADYTTIINCYNRASINARNSMNGIRAGGIAGSGYIIKNCYNYGSVYGYNSVSNYRSYYSYVGGIAGSASTIVNCYNTGYISASSVYAYVYAGGITGGYGNISNCYNVGSVYCSNSNNSNYAHTGGISGSGGTVKNVYWLSTTATSAGSVTGLATSLTAEEMQSEDFVKTLNSNQSTSPFVKWIYVENAYPKFKQIDISEQDEVIITNKKLEQFTITKVDKETKQAIPNTKFAIYSTTSSYETIDFAKDANGNYIGTLNENNIYVLSTDAEGKLTLKLPNGYYKAVEVEAADGYILEENEAVRTTYFKIGETEVEADIEINYIEDLVDLSNSVNTGTTYSGVTIKLAKTLDFNDDESYKDPNDTSYGDYNGDGQTDGIKTELITGSGFKTIGVSSSYRFEGNFKGNGNEIKSIYINDTNTSNYHVGLFGYVQNGVISNLGITGNITGTQRVAGIASYTYNSKITNCYNLAEIESTGDYGYAGGIVAENYNNSIIEDCYNEGSIISNYYAGGIAGYSGSNASIINCYNKGTIFGKQKSGGIAGQSSAIINKCYNTGRIEGNQYVGGITGDNCWGASLYNSYNLGEVVCKASEINYLNVGGVAGTVTYSSIMYNCYNSGNVTCENDTATSMYIGGLVGYCHSGQFVKNCYNTGIVKATTKGELAGLGQGSLVNCYYLNTLGAQGIYGVADATGSVESKTETFMKSRIFEKTLNQNQASITSNVALEQWIQNENEYPTFAKKEFITDSQVTIENEKLNIFTITKVDKDTQNPLKGVKFAIYSTDSSYQTIDFAKDANGNYIGTLNANNIYECETDENGKIILKLPDGYYKAVEIETIAEYVLEESENARTTYFTIGDDSYGADITINYIEDLVDLSLAISKDDSAYQGKTIKLLRSLDFEDENSYRNAYATGYGDYNGDGNVQPIKTELTNKNSRGFLPIGINPASEFYGTFDGNGYEIKNIYIQDSNYGVGLFGYVKDSTICNVKVSGSIIGTASGTGAIVGYAVNTTISNCYNYAAVKGGNTNSGYSTTGGIVGYTYNTKVINCYNEGKVYGGAGIVGYGSSGTEILNCINKGTISGGFRAAGGILGGDYATIINCYNQGKIESAYWSGGIAGYIYVGEITNCYNAGEVGVGTYTGGIIGQGGTLTNNYYLNTTATKGTQSQDDTKGVVEAKTLEEMQSEAFVKILNNNKNVIQSDIKLLDWKYEENSYPTLSLILQNKTSEVTIENERMREVTIIKVDGETNERLSGAEFSVITDRESPELGEITPARSTDNTQLYYIEAEATNVVSGNPNWTGDEYSAGYGVDYANDLNFTMELTEDTECILETAGRFFNGRKFYVYIDGEEFAYYTSLGNTSSYNKVAISLGTLSAGTHTIRFYTPSDVYAPIYDYFRIYEGSYYFTKSGTVYASNNTGIQNSTANSYIKLDLRNYVGQYNLTVNARVFSQANADYGYVTVTESTEAPEYNNEKGRLMCISGSTTASETMTLDAGKVYYIHLGYRKDSNTNYNSDKFYVDSIIVEPINEVVETIITNSEGIATAKLDNGAYTVKETKAPEGYLISNEEVKIAATDKGNQVFTITNKKTEEYFITKVDDKTDEPLSGVKFAIYSVTETYETIDFAKDVNGEYIGENEDGVYVVTTDESGTIKLSLPEGYYKAVEVQAAEGYILEDDENLRTIYFKLEEDELIEISEEDDSVITINYIEDLVNLSNRVNSGDSLEGKTVKLARTLDFNDDSSYKNPNDAASYGDYNGDGTTQSIKEELTNEAGTGFKPIGVNCTSASFKGTFNGNGYEIKNLYINANAYGVGLFSYIGNATICNLGITGNSKIISAGSVATGAFAGHATDSVISNCYSTGTVSGYGYGYGTAGIVGYSSNNKIEDCYFSGDLSGYNYVGGIAGGLYNTEITNCYVEGTISSANATIGGIANNVNNSTIENCYNKANITTTNSGSAGIAYNITNSTVTNCYNKGTITSASGTNGIANSITNSTISSCYNLGSLNSSTTAAGIAYNVTSTKIVNCYNKANIDASEWAHGISGNAGNSEIINCYNEGDINVSSRPASGLVGTFSNNSKMINCYNTGDVYGAWSFGLCYTIQGTIVNCYSTGTLTAANTNYINGIAYAINDGSTLQNNYYLNTTAVSAIYNCEDIEGSYEAKTLEEMQSLTFANTLNENRKSIESTIPLSTWQYSEGATPTLMPLEFKNANEVIITNRKIAQVIVHHYKEGTGPQYGNDPIVLADDETKVGQEGEEYTTSPREDIENYTLSKDENGEDKIPENATGTFISGEQHVYYYYTRDPVKVVVHHYLEGTEDKLAEDENYTYNEGDHYKVTPSEEVLKSYELVEVVGEEEKDIYEDEEIIYYYKLKDHEITTRVEIPDGRSEKGGEITGEGETPYETVLHEQNSVKEIIAKPDEGYKVQEIRLVSTDEEGNKTETVIYGKDEDDTAEISYRVYPDGSVILTQFTNMIEDKEIIVVFAPNEGKVIVHHYIENSTEKIHEDQITKDVIGKLVETDSVENDTYKLVEEPEEKNVTLTEEVQEKTYYYQEEFKITTNVIEHDEKYKDGTVVEDVKGGTITNEDKDPHEAVLKDRDSKEIIEIKPDEGYEIVKITINGKDYNFKENLDEEGNVTLPEGFFESMQEDKHIEVEFRKKTKVIVKYLEEETEKVLYETEDGKDYIEINGYEGQSFETDKKVIPYYQDSDLGITDENKVETTPDGTMFADEITVIYWYEKIPSGIVERHIEINEKGETKEIESETIDGFVSEKVTTNRNEYEGYIPVDGPENSNQDITIVGKDEESKTVTFQEDKVIEVWYYYEKQFEITTEVKPHKEVIAGEEVNVNGGSISKEYITDEDGNQVEVTYEEVLCRADSTKEIVMEPEDGYRIKEITINEEPISLESLEATENGGVKIPVGYFEDVQEDKHVVVEYERIPAKVIVQYKDVYTKESIADDKVVDGYVNDNYDEPRLEIESYIPAEPEPENATGTMTEEVITITYWYTKQFKVTTDVKEHEQTDLDGNVTTVKGGEISGEDEAPYEIVTRGEDSTKEITMKPEEGYRIKGLTINGTEIEIRDIVKEDGSITLDLFKDMQEDKHIVVEYEKIPAKVTVQYLEEGTEAPVSEEETFEGYVNDEYKTEQKDIEYYEFVEERYPENSEGTMTEEEIIVKYYYKKLTFNMKLEKTIEKVLVNGNEEFVNCEDNKSAKLEVEYKNIKETNIEITYNIKVTNTEKVAGTTIIEENIPEGFEFVIESSDQNWVAQEGKYILQTEEIMPGETKEYKVTLRWKQEEWNKGLKQNTAKITQTANTPNFAETTLEDNEDNAIVEIKLNKTIQEIIDGAMDDIKDGNIGGAISGVVDDVMTSVKTGDQIIISMATIMIAGVVIVITTKRSRVGVSKVKKSTINGRHSK